MQSPYVNVERLDVGGIPTLKFSPKGIDNPPTAIYYHGWNSNKDYQRFRLSVFAAWGIQVFAPDAIHHGEREAKDLSSDHLEKYFWGTVIQNVRESPAMIETIISQHQVDPGRLGVMGHSMGGFTAAGVFAANPQLKAMVSFNGSCAWLKMEEQFRSNLNLEPMPEAHRNYLARYDLLSNKETLNQRPVLMLNGAKDMIVPVDSQRWFYQEVAPLYRDCPQRLQLHEIPGVGHCIAAGMLERAIAWFHEYLVAD
ncbi:MAG: alpha/beta hydrolase family protein [Bacillota bacterium]|jgi:dienelactone hydrolase|nr:alpha/beta fold hydrolase [Bacillota bacterium]HPZ22528.1 alpha/beta fold hydrolase [Bacillota bacterium]HQD19811.1 alpha/beta fold hydrolase [Bacillota bacterium]